MSLTAVIILLIIGLALIFIEFLVLPGTNIAGVIGIVLIISGIIFSYRDIGVPVAHYVLGGTFIFLILSIVFLLRSNTWSKLSLNEAIDGKVVNIEDNSVKPGDIGKTITRLAPMGSVLVNNVKYEAKAANMFLDPGTAIEVIRVVGNHLDVKPIVN